MCGNPTGFLLWRQNGPTTAAIGTLAGDLGDSNSDREPLVA